MAAASSVPPVGVGVVEAERRMEGRLMSESKHLPADIVLVAAQVALAASAGRMKVCRLWRSLVVHFRDLELQALRCPGYGPARTRPCGRLDDERLYSQSVVSRYPVRRSGFPACWRPIGNVG